jgi:hypothetical protein
MTELDRNILSITVGHKRPNFEVRSQSKHLCQIGSFPTDLIVQPPILAHLTDAHLSEYHMLFGLANYLRENNQNHTHLSISHYRRFVAAIKCGVVSTNQSHTRIVPPEMASDVYANHRIPPHGDWLIGHPLQLNTGGLVRQFARHHPLSELLRLLVASADEKVISNEFIAEVLNQNLFIPAPSASFMPIDCFLSTMDILERAVRAYLKITPLREFAGYQKRIVAFCLERIHSHLTLSILAKTDTTRITFGYQCVVGYGDTVIASGR